MKRKYHYYVAYRFFLEEGRGGEGRIETMAETPLEYLTFSDMEKIENFIKEVLEEEYSKVTDIYIVNMIQLNG